MDFGQNKLITIRSDNNEIYLIVLKTDDLLVARNDDYIRSFSRQGANGLKLEWH